MIITGDLESINAINEDDLNEINLVLLESFYINNTNINESRVDYKETIIEGFADLLKKMLLENSDITKGSKLKIINFLDKLNTQKENLEIIKSKTSILDIQEASKRLSKKSQSAFELK